MRAHDTLYFDGACGLCRRSTRLLRALDWLNRLEFQDMNPISDGDLLVARETALRGLPMLTRSGRTLVGYPATRRALLQTPLGLLPALLMYVPGVSHAGVRVYRLIAQNRARDLTCQATVPPASTRTEASQTG